MTTPAKRSAPVSAAEDARVIQENRLRAKQSIRQSASARQQSNNNNNNDKNNQIRLEPAKTNRKGADLHQQQQQSSSSSSSSSKSNQNQNQSESNQKKHDPLGNYIEYDLSKLHNSKGGFLVDEDENSKGKTLEEVQRERDRERQRIKAAEEIGISLGADQPVCRDCGSPELSDQLRRVFKFYVCVKCEKKEIYSLLTKTEAKADYLLTDAELNDPDLLPHLLKRNPHKASYSNMMLYLRFQLESFAFGPHKWGSEKNLDLEFEKREEKKKLLSEKKFKKSLNELRKRTKGNVWQKRKDLDNHRHDWLNHWIVTHDNDNGDEDGEDGGRDVFDEDGWNSIKDEIGDDENVTKKMLCKDCGQELEVEEF